MPKQISLIRREFVVNAPVPTAWRHLAQVTRWPSWARHIRRIDHQPGDELGPDSSGVIRLANGLTAKFTMSEYVEGRNWLWTGRFLWLAVAYDHVFESVGENRTRLIFVVDGSGFAASVLGRLFAMVYRRHLERAIPNLIAEINAIRPTADFVETLEVG